MTAFDWRLRWGKSGAVWLLRTSADTLSQRKAKKDWLTFYCWEMNRGEKQSFDLFWGDKSCNRFPWKSNTKSRKVPESSALQLPNLISRIVHTSCFCPFFCLKKAFTEKKLSAFWSWKGNDFFLRKLWNPTTTTKLSGLNAICIILSSTIVGSKAGDFRYASKVRKQVIYQLTFLGHYLCVFFFLARVCWYWIQLRLTASIWRFGQ